MKIEKLEQLDKELQEMENNTINNIFDKLYSFLFLKWCGAIGSVTFILSASILLTILYAEKRPDMFQVLVFVAMPLLFILFMLGYMKDKINDRQFYKVAVDKNIMDKYVNIFETPQDLAILKENLMMNDNNLTYGFVIDSVEDFLMVFKNEARYKEKEMKSEEIIKSFHKKS